MSTRDQSVYRRRRRGAGAILVALVAVATLGLEGVLADGRIGSHASEIQRMYLGGVSDEALVGQMLAVRMDGAASVRLIRQVRRAQIGGVIVFPAPGQPVDELRREVRRLHRAARGRPPLLVTIDQEGGEVKRLAEGPPDTSPPQLGAEADAAAARVAGDETGRFLARLGINADLAPVLDVPSSTSFISERAFDADAQVVATVGTAFAEGLADASTIATAKHFPGLGRSTANTDFSPSTVDASAEEMDEDLIPFRAAIASGVGMVMVGHATYPALGSELPAALSGAIVRDLLRDRLGFRGVAISDDLGAEAVSAQFSPQRAPVAAAQAGIDILLLARTEDGRAAHEALLDALQSGEVSRADLEQSLLRILELKESL